MKSGRTSSKWINRGLEKDLIEPTTDIETSKNRAYSLTSTGKARVRRLKQQADES